MEQEATAGQVVPPCPACGRHGALVALGARRDRLRSWLVWRTTRTLIYTCLTCEATITLPEQRPLYSRVFLARRSPTV